MTQGLFKATATLLTGSVAAHALPLLLGPALTRTYSPEAFGQFALLWTLATNVAVVACARYEYALPLERAASLVAGVGGAILLAAFWGLKEPRPAELVGAAILIGAIVLLSLAPRLAAKRQG